MHSEDFAEVVSRAFAGISATAPFGGLGTTAYYAAHTHCCSRVTSIFLKVIIVVALSTAVCTILCARINSWLLSTTNTRIGSGCGDACLCRNKGTTSRKDLNLNF